MKRKQKRLTLLSLVIVLLFLSSSLNSVKTKAYEWDITQTVTLQEYDNVGYGVFTGDHSMENQYLEAEYDTDLRYVKPGVGSITDTMGNSSKDFRASFVNTYYQTNDRFVQEDDQWQNFPTYLQAFNNTGYGPNLNLTVGLKQQGELSLKEATALEMEPEMVYKYTVSLKTDEIYDLNIKTTDEISYYIYFNGVLSQMNTIDPNHWSYDRRDVNLLQSRGKGEYEIYFYAELDTYIILNPTIITVLEGKANTPVSSHFINDPDLTWNEEKHIFEPNLERKNVHAFFYTLKPGDYQFKYITFNNSIWSQAYIVLPTQYYDNSVQYSYLDFMLSFGTIEKFVLHLEFETQILVYIEGDTDSSLYLEFDYIFSIRNIDDIPIIEEGEQIHYQDDMVNFGLNVNRTTMVYLNYSLASTTDLWCIRQDDEGIIRGYSYTLRQYGKEAAKLILDPGYYFFMQPDIDTYDFLLDFRTIDYEVFNTTSTSFSLQQDNGHVSNYKLFKMETPKFEFVNYNFSLMNNNNYTVILSYKLYIGSYASSVWTHGFSLGTRQLDGVFEGFPKNDAQEMEFFSIRNGSVRYVLIYVNALFNNTGWSGYYDYTDAYVNQTTLLFNLKKDPGFPEAYDDANVHLIDVNLSALGDGSHSTSFTDVINDYDVYMFNATVRGLTWYKIRIIMENGTNYNHNYDLDNRGSVRPYRFNRVGIWNEHYYIHTGSGSSVYFASTEVNGSVVTYETEFGIVSPNLIFMFSVAHVGLNGTFRIEFIPYNCTEILPIDFGDGKGLSTGAIIGLSIVGGLIVAGGIAVLVIKVIVPKVKSKTPMQNF